GDHHRRDRGQAEGGGYQKLSRMGGVSRRRQLACPASWSCALDLAHGWSRPASTSPVTMRSAATAKPSAAAPRKAPRQPKLAAKNRRLAGATAEPRMPAKVWIEYALPMRDGATRCDSRAYSAG